MRLWPLLVPAAWARFYRARDTRLGREVAIKMLRHDGHARLVHEARAVSALNHPNILGLYDICSENSSEFLVMELVRGKTLDQLIGNRGIAVNEAVKYAIPIADATRRATAYILSVWRALFRQPFGWVKRMFGR